VDAMNFLATVLIAIAIATFFVRRYLKTMRTDEERTRRLLEQSTLNSEAPRGLHPRIDGALCIGCATCTTVCPEGDVLAMLGGKAVIANGHKCIGHERCAEACPVGAITMVMAPPSAGSDMPHLTPEYETNIENLFIVGELGGLALIKNAVNEGRACMDVISRRMQNMPKSKLSPDVYDVVIVGAGPAGISASLRAIENKLSYITIERDEVGGTIAKFPRQKIVTTAPLEFPTYGNLNKTELSKEHLLAFWDMVLNRVEFNVCADAMVDEIEKRPDGTFIVGTATQRYAARTVVLAIGRAGNPKKLDVKGESLPKVMYRLIEADHYHNKQILVIGGGDSAVEAAMGLAQQSGNRVTMSYRGNEFRRIKERNAKRIQECVRGGTINVIFNSMPVEFTPESVVLKTGGELQRLPNDFVWIFAGGTPPYDFLKKIGVRFGSPAKPTEATPMDIFTTAPRLGS
jgi:thioredoxin reductase (NADPH)